MPFDKKEDKSYMDGVPVKIAEKFKRPPVIRIPVSCQNCNPGPALYEEYDFRLERSVISKMEEWKKAREEQARKREEKLKRLKEMDEEAEKIKELSLEKTKDAEGEVNSGSSCLPSNILTPINATIHSQPHSMPVPSNFNFSDFEADNSSPFDNMELKTINDMEVLASVLSSDPHASASSKHSSPPANNNNFIPNKNGMAWNGYSSYSQYYPQFNNMYTSSAYNSETSYSPPAWPTGFDMPVYTQMSGHTNITNPYQYHQEMPSGSRQSSFEDSIKQPQKSNSKSVPDLVAELEKELKEKQHWEEQRRKTQTPPPRPTLLPNSGLEDWKPWPDLESPRHSMPDALETLSPAYQSLARGIIEMGFPLPRVVRTMKKFNGDDKKVIEFLIQVQRLEEKKFKGDIVEKALHVNNYDEKATLKHLEATTVLLDLGFDAQKVEQVLLECENDRDTALDRLIS